MLIVTPFFCLLMDITIKIFSNWFARTPIDWQVKEIDDALLIKGEQLFDKQLEMKRLRDIELRRKAELKKTDREAWEIEEEEDRAKRDVENERLAAEKDAEKDL